MEDIRTPAGGCIRTLDGNILEQETEEDAWNGSAGWPSVRNCQGCPSLARRSPTSPHPAWDACCLHCSLVAPHRHYDLILRGQSRRFVRTLDVSTIPRGLTEARRKVRQSTRSIAAAPQSRFAFARPLVPTAAAYSNNTHRLRLVSHWGSTLLPLSLRLLSRAN